MRTACSSLPSSADRLLALLLVGPSQRKPRHVVVIALEITSGGGSCSSTTASLVRDLTALIAQADAVGNNDDDKLWVLLRLPHLQAARPGIAPLADKLVLRPAQSSLLVVAPDDCLLKPLLQVGVRRRGNGQAVAEVELSRGDGWWCVRLQRER